MPDSVPLPPLLMSSTTSQGRGIGRETRVVDMERYGCICMYTYVYYSYAYMCLSVACV